MNHCSCTVPALLDTCPVKRKSLSSFNKYSSCLSSVKNFHLGRKDPVKSYSGNLGRYEKNIPRQRLQQGMVVSFSSNTSPFMALSQTTLYTLHIPFHGTLHRPGNHCHCPMPAVYNLLPPLSHQASPAPTTISSQLHLSPGNTKDQANMAWSFRLLPRETGISFTTLTSRLWYHSDVQTHHPSWEEFVEHWPLSCFPWQWCDLSLSLLCYSINKYCLCFSQQSNNTSLSLAVLCTAPACTTARFAEPGLVSTAWQYHSHMVRGTTSRCWRQTNTVLTHSTSAEKQLSMHSSQSWGATGTLTIFNTLVR